MRKSPAFLEDENESLANSSLGLLNLLETNPHDALQFDETCKTGNVDALLDPSKPLLLQYRLDHLATLVSDNNRGFIESGVVPATKCIMALLLDDKSKNKGYLNILLLCSSLLFKHEKAKNTLIEIGVEKGTSSIVHWLLELMRGSKTTKARPIYSLHQFLSVFISINASYLTKEEGLSELFKLTMFDTNTCIQAVSCSSFSKLPCGTLKKLIHENIENSSHNCCSEFFMLSKQIAAETKDLVSLFSSFFTNFKSNLIKLNNEIKLREDVEGEQNLSEDDEKNMEYTAK